LKTPRERHVFAVLGTVLLAYLLYPFFAFFAGTRGADVTGDLRAPETQEAVVNSLMTAPVATAVAAFFGVPLAYFLARAEFRGKGSSKPSSSCLSFFPLS